MPVTVTRLTPCFAARVDGADITRPLDDATWAEVRAAFEEHSVLVLRGQPLDDDTQIAFSRRFGGLEVIRSMNPAAGTPFARQSNLDIKTGEVIPPDDRRMAYQIANTLWQNDSSFKKVPSLCSLLAARIIPPEGGATEFASARAAYPSLPDALKGQAEAAIAIHDFAWSCDQVRPRPKHPVEPWMLPGAGHHRLLPDGRMESLTPDWHPLTSVTHVLIAGSAEEARRVAVEGAGRGDSSVFESRQEA